MALKIKREILERIVTEEFARYLQENLNEAPPSRGTVLDDEPEDELPPDDEIPNPGEAPEEPLPTDSPAPEAGDDMGAPEELPADPEADDDLDALEAGEEPPSEEEEGTVAGELSGKTIEHVSIDDDSKVMPGATEVVFSFRENPDALRLLISKTGKVKVFYRGLHNGFDSMVSPMPVDDAPEEEMPGDEDGMEDMGDLEGPDDLEDMAPLGDEDMPPPPEEDEELP